MLHHVRQLRDYFRTLIEQHKRCIDYNSGEEPADYIDAILQQRHKLGEVDEECV